MRLQCVVRHVKIATLSINSFEGYSSLGGDFIFIARYCCILIFATYSPNNSLMNLHESYSPSFHINFLTALRFRRKKFCSFEFLECLSFINYSPNIFIKSRASIFPWFMRNKSNLERHDKVFDKSGKTSFIETDAWLTCFVRTNHCCWSNWIKQEEENWIRFWWFLSDY